MNHKGLVTFDRKIKKDAFYLYKAWWTTEEMVHICSKRFQKRTGKTMQVKVYSNCPEVTLLVNGRLFKTQRGNKVFSFRAPLSPETEIIAKAGSVQDQAVFFRVDKPEASYKLSKKTAGGGNWVG